MKDREYAVIDVETTKITHDEIPKTLFWGYADSRGYERFKTTKQFLLFLRKREPKTLLHHGNFDIIQLLRDGGDLQINKSHNGKLIQCKLGEHLTQNSLAIFPESLKKIFKAFNIKKISLKNLDKRNWSDCVEGLQCFLSLNQIFFDLVSVSPLARGTIAATWFGSAELFAGKMPKNLSFLSAYRGGRVELFDTRKQLCKKYDIHSSYPQSFLEAKECEELWEVEVRTKDYWCPLFDSDNNEMLCFPNGCFRSFVFRSNWERYIEPNCEQTAIKIRARHKINTHWLCELKPLIRDIYAKKQNSEGAIRYCCKLLLNSLYGRIGLKGESERCRILPYRADGDDISVHYIGRKRWLTFDTVIREPRSNYPFAAFITDNARARLYESFTRNKAIYGDTDSVFTAESTFKGNIGDECGQWGYEGQKQFLAHNVKDYEWGNEEVRKGGSENLIWSLKRFAKGQKAVLQKRERRQGLRKRLVLPDGTTEPLTVGK